jgi:VCBS repeat-containing protein
MTITNIVENYNPDSPVLSYYSDPLNVANELNSVTFKWPKTVHNGKYALQKRNEKGNWITLKEVKSNADEIILQLQDTDWADDTLVVENADGNPVYHIFKVVATNFAGMISRDEKLLSIYDINTWNDISGL